MKKESSEPPTELQRALKRAENRTFALMAALGVWVLGGSVYVSWVCHHYQGRMMETCPWWMMPFQWTMYAVAVGLAVALILAIHRHLRLDHLYWHVCQASSTASPAGV